jgi:hypothetical protein
MRRRPLGCELSVHEARVVTIEREQAVMGAFLDDTPRLKDDDSVGRTDRAQAVSDDNLRA